MPPKRYLRRTTVVDAPPPMNQAPPPPASTAQPSTSQVQSVGGPSTPQAVGLLALPAPEFPTTAQDVNPSGEVVGLSQEGQASTSTHGLAPNPLSITASGASSANPDSDEQSLSIRCRNVDGSAPKKQRLIVSNKTNVLVKTTDKHNQGNHYLGPTPISYRAEDWLKKGHPDPFVQAALDTYFPCKNGKEQVEKLKKSLDEITQACGEGQSSETVDGEVESGSLSMKELCDILINCFGERRGTEVRGLGGAGRRPVKKRGGPWTAKATANWRELEERARKVEEVVEKAREVSEKAEDTAQKAIEKSNMALTEIEALKNRISALEAFMTSFAKSQASSHGIAHSEGTAASKGLEPSEGLGGAGRRPVNKSGGPWIAEAPAKRGELEERARKVEEVIEKARQDAKKAMEVSKRAKDTAQKAIEKSNMALTEIEALKNRVSALEALVTSLVKSQASSHGTAHSEGNAASKGLETSEGNDS